MMGMGKKVSDVLGPKKDPASSDEGEYSASYDAFTEELKDILGLDDDKAQRLRDAICGLAREEMEMGDDEGEEPASGEEASKKKPGVAIVLGMGGKPGK